VKLAEEIKLMETLFRTEKSVKCALSYDSYKEELIKTTDLLCTDYGYLGYDGTWCG
jgi:hypothetical protein